MNIIILINYAMNFQYAGLKQRTDENRKKSKSKVTAVLKTGKEEITWSIRLYITIVH